MGRVGTTFPIEIHGFIIKLIGLEMLYLEFIGKSNKKERLLIENAFRWSYQKLIPRYKIYITCHVIANIDREGDTIFEDAEYNPREFLIRIKKNLPEEDLITLVFHEMVHVKQFAKKELRYTWDNKSFNYKIVFNNKDTTELSYLDRPYEKEAYKLQESLYKEYIK